MPVKKDARWYGDKAERAQMDAQSLLEIGK